MHNLCLSNVRRPGRLRPRGKRPPQTAHLGRPPVAVRRLLFFSSRVAPSESFGDVAVAPVRCAWRRVRRSGLPARCAWASTLARLPLSGSSRARPCRGRQSDGCFAQGAAAPPAANPLFVLGERDRQLQGACDRIGTVGSSPKESYRCRRAKTEGIVRARESRAIALRAWHEPHLRASGRTVAGCVYAVGTRFVAGSVEFAPEMRPRRVLAITRRSRWARRRALRLAPARATHGHAGCGLRQAVVAHVDPSWHTRGAVRVAPWGSLGQDRDRGSPGARQSSRCLCCCPAVEAVPRAVPPQARRPVCHRPASRARLVRAPVSSRWPSRPC